MIFYGVQKDYLCIGIFLLKGSLLTSSKGTVMVSEAPTISHSSNSLNNTLMHSFQGLKLSDPSILSSNQNPVEAMTSTDKILLTRLTSYVLS